MSDRRPDSKLEQLETDLLLEAVLRYYGYDFRDYEPSAVRRRIREAMLVGRCSTVSRFQDKVLREPAVLDRFLRGFSRTGLSMFCEPNFYRSFRERVVPLLKTYPFIRIWLAGCSTGEEVYSLAILLEEEDINQRSRIYATDLSEEVVKEAHAGSFRASARDEFAENYLKAGGKRSLSDYLKKKGSRLLIDPVLKRNIVFSEHNLATDGSFNEFQVIVCRDVLGNFNHKLRERAGRLIYESLSRFGVLALGAKETINELPYENDYAPLDGDGCFYQKNGSSIISTFVRAGATEAQRQ